MRLSYIFGVFGVICLIFAMIYSSNVTEHQVKTLSGSGGIYGPLVVPKNNTSYEVTIKNNVALNAWSNIEVDVLDSNKQHLFSFGEGMWHERGRDSDGSWQESKTSYSMDITFQKAGEYYFNVSAERNDGGGNPIIFSIAQKRGSSVAFIVLGVFSLVLGIATFYISTNLMPDTKLSNVQKIILIVVLIVLFVWALSSSSRGYGYMGYNGYHRGPSFFYMWGPSIYHQRSNRDGSIGGAGHRGGGFSSGK